MSFFFILKLSYILHKICTSLNGRNSSHYFVHDENFAKTISLKYH